MNLKKKIILAVGVIAATAASYAQQSAAGTTPVGILGRQYSELSFGVQDIKHLSTNAYSVGLAGNAPIAPNLDLGAAYSYGWIRGGIDAHQNTLSTSATLHTTYSGMKPFATVALGYQWIRGNAFRDDLGVWGGAVGLEVPVGAFTVTPTLAYTDDFRRPSRSSQEVIGNVEANHWFSQTTAGFAGVGYGDTQQSGSDSWNYSIGLRMKF